MDNETENENQEELITIPVSESIRVQTFSKLPDEESDSEKLKHIESMIEQLWTAIGDEDENRASYEEIHQYFKSLKSSTDALLYKLDNEVSYTKSLEEKLKRRTTEYENVQLKKALVEEQGKMTIAAEEFREKVTSALETVQRSFDSIQTLIDDKCSLIDEKASKIIELKDQIDNLLIDYNQELQKSAKAQYQILQNNCKDSIDEVNGRVGEVKENVLEFLKICRKQNQELIKKIPEQKRKVTLKDGFIYALCGMCIFEMIVQIYMMWGK